MADATVGKVGTIVKEEPTLRFSKSGKPFVKFSLQVKPYVPRGEPQPEAIYYEVTAFGSLAEHIAQSRHKGDRVVVVGTGKLDRWTGNDGQERTTKTILADGVGPDERFVLATIHEPEAATRPVAAPRQAAQPEYAEDEEPF